MLFRAIFLGLWAWWCTSPFTANLGGMFIGGPLVTGTVVGLVLGDPLKGMLVGGTINLIYLGVISAGGSTPADATKAGVLGTAAAITGGLTAQQALAIAIPIGLLGVYLSTLTMTVSSIFPAWADKYAAEGNTRGIEMTNLLPRQIVNFPFQFIPTFLVVMYGGDVVKSLITLIPPWLNNGLNAAGKLLPAVGVAMLLQYMGRTKLLPFFFLGFLFAAYGSKDLMLGGLLGILIGIVYIQLEGTRKEVQA